MRLPGLALAALCLLFAVLLLLGTVGAQDVTRYLPGVDTSLPGSATYAAHCLACHGPSGLGLAESAARFPADHQQCSRCHNPRNPPTLREHAAANDLAVFSLGEPTPLADAAYLARFPSLAVLEAYVRAAMPRWDPGKLSPAEARAVSLYVLHLSGSVPEGLQALYYEGGDSEALEAIDAAAVPLGR